MSAAKVQLKQCLNNSKLQNIELCFESFYVFFFFATCILLPLTSSKLGSYCA